jgi:hypothetical protein
MRCALAFVTVACAMALLPARADAQQLSLRIDHGVVDLDAENVSVRQILREWARIGGVTIVNADKTSETPVTLRLADLAEKAALEVLLRGVGGYVLAPRVDGGGPSAFSRILILPTSAAPTVVAGPASGPAAAPAAFAAAAPAFVAPPRSPVESANDDPGDAETASAAAAAAAAARRLGGLQPIAPGGRPFRPGEALPYRIEVEDEPPAAASPAPAPASSTAASPFGTMSGSTQMGVTSPVPPATAPRQRTRIVTQPPAERPGATGTPAGEPTTPQP